MIIEVVVIHKVVYLAPTILSALSGFLIGKGCGACGAVGGASGGGTIKDKKD